MFVASGPLASTSCPGNPISAETCLPSPPIDSPCQLSVRVLHVPCGIVSATPCAFCIVQRCLQRIRVVGHAIAHRAEFLHAALRLLRRHRPQIRHLHAVRIRERYPFPHSSAESSSPRSSPPHSSPPAASSARFAAVGACTPFTARCRQRARHVSARQRNRCRHLRVHIMFVRRLQRLRRIAIQIQRPGQRAARRSQKAPVPALLSPGPHMPCSPSARPALPASFAPAPAARLACAAAGTTQYCVLAVPSLM